MASRLEQLLSYAEEDPNDPFNLYAVALEYIKLGSEKADEFFQVLIRDHQDYIPTYYTYGKWLHDNGKLEDARRIFVDGKKLAQSSNDLKAVRELTNAINEIDFDL